MTTAKDRPTVEEPPKSAKIKAVPKQEDVMDEVPLEEKNTIFKDFMDRQRTAIGEARKALEGLMPEAFREHSKTAYQEFVESYRELFNTAIDEVVETIERAKFKDEHPEN